MRWPLTQTLQLTPFGLSKASKQTPLAEEDVFFGETNSSSVRHESDLSPYKPRCDVILNATAYAPENKPTTQFRVQLVVRPSSKGAKKYLIDKTLLVSGERTFRKRWLISRWCCALLKWTTLGLVRIAPWRLTSASRLTSLPLRYEFAYGGQCRINVSEQDRKRMMRRIGNDVCLKSAEIEHHPDSGNPSQAVPLAHIACEHNPLGRGFAAHWYLKGTGVKAIQAPQIERLDQKMSARAFWRVANGKQTVLPGSFGAVGRAWLPRRSLIGQVAMKQSWDADEIPTLPEEFDHGYWNAAPRDQQCAYLSGDEEVVLVNLCKANHPLAKSGQHRQTLLRFHLPGSRAYLALGDEFGRFAAKEMLLDTVLIDVDAGTVDLIWRAAVSSRMQLSNVQIRFASTAEEKSQLDDMIELQILAGRIAADSAEEIAHAA